MITANELIDSLPCSSKPWSYEMAIHGFTCGACHVLAYEMFNLLMDDSRYRVACLGDHAFIIDVYGDKCYDITGELPTCEMMEKWADDWEECVCEFHADELDEYIEISNEMYKDDIEPNADTRVMMNARYWSKKIVEAIKCGATNELNEKVQEYMFTGEKIKFNKILEKHLKNSRLLVV